MRKLVTAFTVSTMILTMSSFAFASEANLTFKEAKDLAQSNSIVLGTIDKKIDLQDRITSNAQVASKNLDLDAYVSDSQYLSDGKKKDLTPAQEERKLRDLKDTKADEVVNVEVATVKAYVTLRNQIDAAKNDQVALDTAKAELAAKQKQLDLGQITNSDLNKYKIVVQELELALVKANRVIVQSEMELNKLVGNPLDLEITLAGTVDLEIEEIIYDIEKLVMVGRTNADEVVTAQDNLDLHMLEMKVIKKYSRYELPDNFEDMEENQLDLEQKLAEAKDDAEVKIRSDYNALLNKKDDVTIAQLRYDLSFETYEITKLKANLGLLTFLDVQKATDDLRSKNEALNQAKLDLYTSKLTYDQYISNFQ